MSEKAILFDPGYGRYMTSFINNIEYMYSEINKYKNLGQKKFKFKYYYPQIASFIEQNTLFYLGCLLWATYVVTQKGAELSGNLCLGNEYDENTSLEEINYLSVFVKALSKDTKYYLNIDYKYPDASANILKVYKEFAKLNNGFVNSRTADDIKLPSTIKMPENSDITKIYEVITKDVITTGDFVKLWDLKQYIGL